MQNPKQPPPSTRLARRKAREELSDDEREARRLARRKAREQRYAAVRADRVGGFYVYEELGPAWGIWYSRDHLRRLCNDDKFPKPSVLQWTKRKDGTHTPARIGWAHEALECHREEVIAKCTTEPGSPEIDEDARETAA
jgi:hypothetical protein